MASKERNETMLPLSSAHGDTTPTIEDIKDQLPLDWVISVAADVPLEEVSEDDFTLEER